MYPGGWRNALCVTEQGPHRRRWSNSPGTNWVTGDGRPGAGGGVPNSGLREPAGGGVGRAGAKWWPWVAADLGRGGATTTGPLSPGAQAAHRACHLPA